MPAEWFTRLREVPGVGYDPPTAIDRSSLPAYDEAPEVKEFSFGETQRSYVGWGDIETPVGPPDDPEAEIEYSDRPSPAMRRAEPVVNAGSYRTDNIVRSVWEALELPGTPEDYYRIIEGAVQRLQDKVLKDPEVLETIEALAWLEVKLLVSRPEVVVHDEYVWHSQAFATLIRLYEDEGFVADAMRVAELGEHFRKGESERELLLARIEALQSERAA